jgi:DNA-binding FadR family transcriptional regulator
VRDQLLAAIHGGAYPIGSKLPSERELTELFGVSRVSVREGIRSLEAMGLVEVRHGNGCYVRSVTPHATADLAQWLGTHRDEVLEMMTVRGALDEVAATQAAANGSAPALQLIVAAHDAFVAEANRAGGARFGDLARLDIAFHVAIAEASHSRLLTDLLSELHTHLTEARRLGFESVGRSALAVQEHESIVHAILAHDVASARAAVSRHMDHVSDVLRTAAK